MKKDDIKIALNNNRIKTVNYKNEPVFRYKLHKKPEHIFASIDWFSSTFTKDDMNFCKRFNFGFKSISLPFGCKINRSYIPTNWTITFRNYNSKI